MISSAVEELVLRWRDIIAPPGLDWASLEGGVEGTAYLQALLQEVSVIYDVVGKLDIEAQYRTLRVEQARASLDELIGALNQASLPALEAIKNDVWDLSVNDALQMSKEGLKNAMATMAAYAANGAQLHFDGVMYQGIVMGRITPAEVQEHANLIARMAQTLSRLEREGALDEIRRQTAMAGLGAIVIPAWMLIVAGVFLVMGIAYLVWSTHRASVLQDQVVSWCDNLIKNDPENAGQCIDAVRAMQNDSLNNLFAPIQSVVKWLGVGLLVYVAALAAPALIKGVAQVARSTKEAR